MEESKIPPQEGATALISHHVRKGQEEAYDAWLNEVTTACKQQNGYLDIHVIRPVPGVTETHSIMLRFDTPQNLEQWMNSTTCKELIDKVQSILSQNEDIYIKSGLDFWFTPQGAQAQLPKCWKQLVVTWSAIYPISLVLELLITPVLKFFNLNNLYFNLFVVTGLSVWAMVYVVMPYYTKLVQRWLFDEPKKPSS